MFYKFFRWFASLLLSVALLAITSAPQPAHAAGTWFVSPGGDDNQDCLNPETACATINGAIGKAASEDTIKVTVGTYSGGTDEAVLINKSITLSGGWDLDFTSQTGNSVVDGQTARRCIVITSGVVAAIDRFTVQNGLVHHSEGGGIRIDGGTLTLTNSTVTGNSAGFAGSGIYNNSGTVHVIDSLITKNVSPIFSGAAGGGIFTANEFGGSLSVTNSIISFNRAEEGGGIFGTTAVITINHSAIYGNEAVGQTARAGGILSGFSQLDVNNSAIVGNLVNGITSPGNFFGGGIVAFDGTSNIVNSTISGNVVMTSVGGTTHGGGIFNFRSSTFDGGNLNINNVTIADNQAMEGGGIMIPDAGRGFATVNLQNTILARNRAFTGPDCSGPLLTAGYNLISDTSNCDFTASSLDLVNMDPLLGSIQHNDDFTFTNALLPSSPAIDAGNPDGCTDQYGDFLTTDQRGVARPQGTNCDMGAFEFDGQIFPPANDEFVNAEAITSLPFSTTVIVAAYGVEPGEPQQCSNFERTAWYIFNPTETMTVRLNTISNVNVYSALGSGFGNLSFQGCTNDLNGSFQFTAEAGQTYYLQADSINAVQVTMEQVLPPVNDNFADATVVSSLPFDDSVDISAASTETDEPTPSCAINGLSNTVWYAFTSNTTGSISASNPAFSFIPVMAAYTGGSLNSLTEVSCQPNGIPLTFHTEAGTTYYFQAGMEGSSGHGGSMQFHVEVTPPPVVDFGYSPSEPSAFDTITFFDFTSDPGQAGFQSFTWDFGDGTSSTGTESFVDHQYARDGDYTVQHSVTTVDGRTGSTSQVVQVRTHDVSITRITTPRSANAGQTKSITVSIRNTRYPETVRVDLYKSTPGGDVFIDTLTLQVPASAGNRTKQFTFNYTFTIEDSEIGKVSFRAEAFIEGANDAFPQDNIAFSSPPTRVGR